MISLSNVSYEVGDRKLLNQINLTLKPHDKIGLVGANGIGKSTLLKIFAQKIDQYSGEINIKKGTKLYYIPQEIVKPSNLNTSIFNYAKKAFKKLYEKEQERLKLLKLLNDNTSTSELEKIIKIQEDIEESLQKAGFYEIESKIKKILIGLGFDSEELSRPIADLSGGWLMRLELAKILLSNPDIILLDEPTNHLDKKSINWLKDFLMSSDIGFVIVAHDRDFLNSVVDEIWELENGIINKYRGNFDFFIEQKKRILKEREKDQKKLEKRIKEINLFVERFRAKATKAKQVQSRLKLLEKISSNKTEAIKPNPNFKLRLPINIKSGKIVLELQNISKCFNKKVIFSNASFLIKRGQKIAAIGPNGVGKSTLLKIIAQKITPDSGTIKWGHNVITAYFAQHQSTELNEELTIIETLKAQNPHLSETKARTILGIFMFKEDEVYKKIKVLSGGEKTRLALAKVMAKGANLLLLDEPTNHLDNQAKMALKNALKEFEGSIIIISHDFNFLNGLVDSVLRFEDKNIILFNQGLESFNKNDFLQLSGNKEKNRAFQDKRSHKITKKEKRRLVSEIRQEKSKIIAPLKKEMTQLEKRIEDLEIEKEEIEKKLYNTETYKEKDNILTINKRYKEIQKLLDALYNKWDIISLEFDKIEKKFNQKIEKIINNNELQ